MAMAERSESGRRLRRAGLISALMALVGAYAVAEPPEVPVAPAPPTKLVAERDPLRQTEQDAIEYARKIGAPVEVGAFRGETQSVFANPDGTTTDRQYAQPVRVVRNGAWAPIDATLEKQPDKTYAPKATTFGLRLSGGGDGPLITAERAGRSMSLEWPGRLPAPTVAGARATYAEVLPGVDLVVNVGETNFSHVLVVKTPEAAQNPELATVEFGLETTMLDVRETPAGGLSAVDEAAGTAVFEAATPMMWDSGMPAASTSSKAQARAQSMNPQPLTAAEEPPPAAERTPMDLTVTADTLTLTPDAAMLADPQTTFPVYIDPVWVDTRASGWAMVSSGYASEEYYKFSGTEGLGECPVSSGTCAGTGIERLFYSLPTPYTDKDILRAEFAVTMTHTYDGSARDVSLYHAKSGISSSTNWNNQPDRGVKQDTKAPTSVKSECTSSNQNVRFDAKNIVGDAAEKKRSTTTFALKADNESDHRFWKRFCGNAILEVTYNRKPNTPIQTKLTMNPGGSCVAGSTRPYVPTAPTISAVLTDPDKTSSNNEQLTAEFKVYWIPAGGTEVTSKPYRTGRKASGSTFSVSLADAGLPENIVISWEVRANDGTAYGEWSSYGGQTRCEFIYDKTRPLGPDIDSEVYLPNDKSELTFACAPDNEPPDPETGEASASWRGHVGKYGKFVFDSVAADVVEYKYGFDTSASTVLKPATAGGPVEVTWMPETDGSHIINVIAKDRSGWESGSSCTFFVPTRLSVGEWGLGDDGDDARDQHDATAGSSATFGVAGPSCPIGTAECTADRAVRLAGDADGYLSTSSTAGIVDTSKAFSVTAWVRLTDDTTDHVAVSQDGTGESGFTLGFDRLSKKWTFSSAWGPVRSLGAWSSVSSAPAVLNQWTQLTGVYDPVKATIQLYVNGTAQAPAAKRNSWRSFGAVQIGRGQDHSGYRAHWVGDLADVAVYDRILVTREAKALAFRRAQRTAYWPLDEQVGSQSLDYDSDAALNLAGGAAVVSADMETAPPADWAMVGSGHLVLDGTDDYAGTTAPVAATNGSYTIAARVRLAGAACTRNMTVVAQSGTKESGFTLRCNASNQWEAILPQLDGTDGNKAPVVLTGDGIPNSDRTGTQLALVYDAFLHRATFYVNGQVIGSASGNFTADWTAAGPLNVGRSLRGSAYGDYFAGVIDEVRVYAGVLDDSSVQRLGALEPDPDI